MLVLALDTTTRQGSVALMDDGRVLSTFAGDPTITHGERLPADLVRVLEAHSVTIANVDVFAVAAGPGSFTGLRVGIATMQGLAMANGRSLVGVSALDAINHGVRSMSPPAAELGPDTAITVWMDAQRGEVFSAVYAGEQVIDGPVVGSPAAILARWTEKNPARMFAGDGAIAYRDVIQNLVAGAAVLSDLPPLAPSIARLAAAYERQHGPSAPDAIRPIYVRRPDAELARDRRAGELGIQADLKVSTTYPISEPLS
jgi:tRNA threonylcarbamoyladenosine biosynthesis protein TsaB